MKYIVLMLLALSMSMSAAELPSQGIDPPAILFRPDAPPNPPVGNGLAIVVGFTVLYALKKRKMIIK